MSVHDRLLIGPLKSGSKLFAFPEKNKMDKLNLR